jgi:hypothetical protein
MLLGDKIIGVIQRHQDNEQSPEGIQGIVPGMTIRKVRFLSIFHKYSLH